MSAREVLIEAWKLRNPNQGAEIEALLDVLPALGLALVHRTPTEAMRVAGNVALDTKHHATAVWDAMLSATNQRDAEHEG